MRDQPPKRNINEDINRQGLCIVIKSIEIKVNDLYWNPSCLRLLAL